MPHHPWLRQPAGRSSRDNRAKESKKTDLSFIIMTAFKSDFLNLLQRRGFIHQISDPESLDAIAAKGGAVAYVGYDCTAPSLHVGHLLSIMMLHWLQQTGNKPIALMGGGTTRVRPAVMRPANC